MCPDVFQHFINLRQPEIERGPQILYFSGRQRAALNLPFNLIPSLEWRFGLALPVNQATRRSCRGNKAEISAPLIPNARERTDFLPDGFATNGRASAIFFFRPLVDVLLKKVRSDGIEADPPSEDADKVGRVNGLDVNRIS